MKTHRDEFKIAPSGVPEWLVESRIERLIAEDNKGNLWSVEVAHGEHNPLTADPDPKAHPMLADIKDKNNILSSARLILGTPEFPSKAKSLRPVANKVLIGYLENSPGVLETLDKQNTASRWPTNEEVGVGPRYMMALRVMIDPEEAELFDTFRDIVLRGAFDKSLPRNNAARSLRELLIAEHAERLPRAGLRLWALHITAWTCFRKGVPCSQELLDWKRGMEFPSTGGV